MTSIILFGHFIVDFENILHLFSSVYILDFGQVNVCLIVIMVILE